MTKREAEAEVHRCQQTRIGACDGRGWHRYTYHQPTGIMWAEEYRPKYGTKAEAVAAVLAAEAERQEAEA